VLHGLEQTLGLVVLMLILLDIFLTVLYARMGTGIISARLARAVWKAFLRGSKLFGRRRQHALSFCGPTIVIMLLVVWALGLTCGAALIIHPQLGAAIRNSSEATPTDFVTALYAAGSSISIVGSSNFTPHTSGFRLFYLVNSLIGLSVVSLTLTYLMQVYNALQQRNTFGLKLYLLTSQTADAAELIAGLGRQGQFSSGYSNLVDLGAEMTQVKEMHHFYPVLVYFRFGEAYYSLSMSALLALDTVTLLRTALHDEEYDWLKESASVSQLWNAALLLLTSLEDTFLPGGTPDTGGEPDARTKERWKARYLSALQRFRRAGIRTAENDEAGTAAYISMRTEWDGYITALAPFLAYSMSEIDPAANNKVSMQVQSFSIQPRSRA
jgi:Ion channel